MLNLKVISYLKSKQPLGIFLLVVFIIGIVNDSHQLNHLIGELKAVLSVILLDVGQSLVRASSSL
ncbi:MAG: hypothetical protein [Caudoviricetes sp.]|nr:MAG: hypothetical protein [Caudoviricetes sp.]